MSFNRWTAPEDMFEDWSRANVLDTAAAAHYAGLAAATIRGAINRGELPAWKPDGSKVWLMFRDDVDTWRKARREYTTNSPRQGRSDDG